MADRLNLAVAAFFGEVVHAVHGRRCRDAEVVVVQTVEAVLRRQRIDAVGDGIPFQLDLFEIPLLVVVGRRRDVDVVEEVERR